MKYSLRGSTVGLSRLEKKRTKLRIGQMRLIIQCEEQKRRMKKIKQPQ